MRGAARRRVAVVSGASRGIGLEIARQLGTRGIRVVVGARMATAGEAAAAELRSAGGDAHFLPLDVTREDQVAALAADVERRFGGADILVNNAGVMLDPRGSTVLQAAPEVFRATLEVNFFGALTLAQALVPGMRRRNYGRVVNLSSGLGQLHGMGAATPAYRVSKVALNALTCMLAAELAGSDVLVNSVCPGWVRTDMGGPHAARSVEQGADTAVWLATLPSGGPSGGFFRDRKPIPW